MMHITSVHRWNDTRIYAKEARALAAAGFNVALVAPDAPNDVRDGVRLIGIPTARTRFGRMVWSVGRIGRIVLRERPAVVHGHDPELLPLLLLCRLFGATAVYDAHEDLPKDVLDKGWIPRPLRRMTSRGVDLVERWMARGLNLVIAATPAIGRRFPAAQVAVVQNYPFIDELAPRPGVGRVPGLCVFVGGLLPHRGLEQLCDAIEILGPKSGIRLAVAGRFGDRDVERAVTGRVGWEKVEYLGELSREDVGELLARAAIGLVLYQPIANHVESQPTKLYEYMSAGVAILGADYPAWREIVVSKRCGALIDASSPAAIATKLRELVADPEETRQMGERGRSAVVSGLNWEAESKVLITAYGALIRDRQ